MNNSVIFRVDANKKIGSGHLIRCLILARAFHKQNINVHFVCETLTSAYRKKLMQNDINFTIIREDKTELEAILKVKNQFDDERTALVVDSDKEIFYKKHFQKSIRETGLKLVIITFRNDAHFYSDAILNQNLMALKHSYSVEPYTKKLLGTQFVVLDEKFRNIREEDSFQPNEDRKNIWLIYFGSSDQVDRTSWALSALLQMKTKPEAIYLVVGTMYSNMKRVEQLISTSTVPVQLYQNTPRMPELMAESKFAITSGGLTAWELGLLEVTNIIVGESDREYRSGKFLADEDYCYFLGKKEKLSEVELSHRLEEIINLEDHNRKRVKRLSRRINPNGIKRVVEEIINL